MVSLWLKLPGIMMAEFNKHLVMLLTMTFRDRHHNHERSVLASLVRLAIAILCDLGLDKRTSLEPAVLLLYELKGILKRPQISNEPTMEERRALLGCFLLSSM